VIGRSAGALSIVLALFGVAWGAQRDSPPKGGLIASIQGPALYKAYCAACHGPEAKGNGPVASTLKLPPADLTRISARNGGTFPLMRIERIISGQEERRGHGAMPAWGPVFSQVGRDQDLTYEDGADALRRKNLFGSPRNLRSPSQRAVAH